MEENMKAKEWFDLSYDEFLERVITLAAAKYYGFTPDDLIIRTNYARVMYDCPPSMIIKE